VKSIEENRLPVKKKWLLAIALMTFFHSTLLYVNLISRTLIAFWQNAFFKVLIEYILGIFFVMAFIFLAERILEFFYKKIELPTSNSKNILINIASFISFILTGALLVFVSISIVNFTLVNFFKMPDIILLNTNYSTNIRFKFIFFQYLVLILVIYFIILNRNYNFFSKEIKLKTENLQKQQVLNQFTALKSQVNPHFLFNSLSVLSSLVRVDSQLSEKFIDRLAKAYRYTLEQREHNLVLLKDELEFVNAYFFLLQARFENKIALQNDITNHVAEHKYIVPLTLQVLIENSIRYNKMSLSQPLKIYLSEQEGYLKVSNSYQPRPLAPNEREEKSFETIAEQYKAITPLPIQTQIENNLYEVTIPLL
jgi:two-component system, LytTR family, sensor kinase